MSRTVIVMVREREIRTARAQDEKSCQNCPIAIALVTATRMKGWGVSRSGCFHPKYGRIPFPEKVTQWIDQYDEHKPVNHLSFPIVLTEPI